jgi:hypothetical protein
VTVYSDRRDVQRLGCFAQPSFPKSSWWIAATATAKDAARQIYVADAIMQNLKASPLRALMLENHLVAGVRPEHHRYMSWVRGNGLTVPASRRLLGPAMLDGTAYKRKQQDLNLRDFD